MISNIQLDDGCAVSATSLEEDVPLSAARDLNSEEITSPWQGEVGMDDFLIYPRPFRVFGGNMGVWDYDQQELPIRTRKGFGAGGAILLTISSLGNISGVAASTNSNAWKSENGGLPIPACCSNTAASAFDHKSPLASQVERVNHLLVGEEFEGASVHSILRILSALNETGHSVRTIEKTQDRSIVIHSVCGANSTLVDFYPDGDIVFIQDNGQQEKIYEFSVDKTPEIVALLMNGSM